MTAALKAEQLIKSAVAFRPTGSDAFRPIAHSAADLLDQVFPPINFLIPGLLPEGTWLIAGKPKSGKSWFTLNVAIAVCLGFMFLDRQATMGAVLLLALEDNERRVQSRLKILLRDHGDSIAGMSGLQFRCEWPAGNEGVSALETYLSEHRTTKLVIIDTLKRIRGIQDCRRSSYELDYEAIQPWKDLADKYGVTLLIVHHTRKAEAEDPFDTVSGTLGLTGAVDGIILLRRVPGESRQATMHVRGRDLEEDAELGLELTNGWWRCIGSAQSLAMNASRKVIVGVLTDYTEGRTVAELLKDTGKKSRTSLDKLLKHMLSDGVLVKSGPRFKLSPFI